jgi:hypothetical protein
VTETIPGSLRRAAKLMRERAALVPPAPWFPAVHDVTTYDGLDVIASSGLTVRAQYVASWHPLVAAAVADWLDEVADDRHACLDAWVEVAALRIARAYLSESGQVPEPVRAEAEEGTDG